MTSATGAAGHPDVDEISALTEGLLSPSRTAVVRNHLKACTDCSDTYVSLQEIRELLGTVLPPEPMPIDIAERIDAALAAEVLLAASAPAPSLEVLSSDSVSPDDPSSSPDISHGSNHQPGRQAGTHVSRETSPVDAPGAPGGRPAARPRGSTGPGRTGRSRFGRRRKSITFGAVFTVVVIGLGTVLFQTMTHHSPGRPIAGTTAHPTHGRHTFSSGTLEGQVTTLLKSHHAPKETAQPPGTPTPKPSLDMGSPDGSPSATHTPTRAATPLKRTEIAVEIPDCVRHGIGRSEAPIAAEQGTYEGSDAYLVVLPDARDQAKVSAYVVDASCAQKPSAPEGKVLLTHSYPRD